MRTKIFPWAVVFVLFLVAIVSYPFLPEQIASHWNQRGEVDGYMAKSFGVFFLPLISLFLLFLFLLIPKIDPLGSNIEKFRKIYDGFVAIMLLFMLYIYILIISWNIGYKFDMNSMIMPVIGVLFYYCGILIEKAKRNWFIGIRTPWTLSSENVWNKTHKIGAKLFKAAGSLAFLGAFLGEYGIFLVIAPVIAISVYLIIYSYFEYKKEAENK